MKWVTLELLAVCGISVLGSGRLTLAKGGGGGEIGWRLKNSNYVSTFYFILFYYLHLLQMHFENVVLLNPRIE